MDTLYYIAYILDVEKSRVSPQIANPHQMESDGLCHVRGCELLFSRDTKRFFPSLLGMYIGKSPGKPLMDFDPEVHGVQSEYVPHTFAGYNDKKE